MGEAAGGLQTAQRVLFTGITQALKALDQSQHKAGGEGQQVQAAPVFRLGPDPPVETRHGLQVVPEYMRPSVDHLLQHNSIPHKVRDQYLHGAIGGLAANLADGLRPNCRPAVGQLITVHRGDHAMTQPHQLHRLAHPARLVRIQGGRSAGGHRTEATGAGAYLSQDHQSGGAVLPALVNVGAAGFLAHRVQPPSVYQHLKEFIVISSTQFDFNPRRPAHRGGWLLFSRAGMWL